MRASPSRAARRPARALLRAGVAVTAAATATAATACQAVVDRAFQRPTVAFRGAAMRAIGPEGGVVDVRLLVRNPNPYPLSAERATYRLLAADSTEVGRGEATDSLRVPARDSAEVRLPVVVSWPALVRTATRTLGTSPSGTITVPYRVVGELRVRTPVGVYPVPVDAVGQALLRPPGGLGGALGGLLRR